MESFQKFIDTFMPGCPTSVFGRENCFYVLSDNQTTADVAQSICMNAGGRLTSTNNKMLQDNLMEYSMKKLIPPGCVMCIISFVWYNEIS